MYAISAGVKCCEFSTNISLVVVVLSVLTTSIGSTGVVDLMVVDGMVVVVDGMVVVDIIVVVDGMVVVDDKMVVVGVCVVVVCVVGALVQIVGRGELVWFAGVHPVSIKTLLVGR